MAAAKACGDTCNSAADSGFMCLGFDSTLHSVNDNDNRLDSSRVWMCDVCEQAPAAVACKADAAALCVTCDADIHSANHLADRHLRVPIPTFLNSQQQDAALGSWLLPTPTIKTGDLFFSQTDPFQVQQDQYLAMEQIEASAIPVVNDENSFHIDFSPHKLPTFSFQSESLSHSVSSSSVEVGVVPDGNSMSSSDISYPLGRAMTDVSVPISAKTSSNRAAQDRDARVSRYREKRKKRMFQKTVRYVSRKAYAESRPRIKGRFVKRSQIQHQADHHMYN